MLKSSRKYLWDFKAIHGGGGIYHCARARDEHAGAVAERAHRINGGAGGGEYGAHARELDAVINAREGTPGGTAAAAHLRSFTQVRGLVVGEYAEASPDVHALITLAGHALARKHWRRMGARNEKEARSWWVADCRKRIGVAVARAYARFRTSRMPYIGMARAALVEARERRLTQAANRRHGRDPYAADLHAFWVYQERVRPNAD